MHREALLRRYHLVLGLFIIGLILSGLTAFPLLHELRLMASWLGIQHHADYASHSGLSFWIGYVWHGLEVTQAQFPYVAYGTDWLAFAHLAIAVAFVGPLIDPVRNVWVTIWGLIMCAGIVPLALIAGAVRGLPLGWQLIDISFGVVAAVPLTIAVVLTRRLERSRVVVR